VEPWGWTWVDDAPWGFAPFHYGRWVYVGYWAWVPGPVAVRPVYAPALVAWVGGPSFGVSFGTGVVGVAWFPLGPREVYVPAYHASPVYINRVNVTNTTIVNNINITNINTTNVRYINREAPGAVTAVPQSALAGARPVQSAAVAVPVNAIRSARIMNTAPVAPSRQSVLGAATLGGGRIAQPPAAVQNRPVVAKIAPPAAPVPFAQRQQALAANPGRPLDSGEVQRLRGDQPTQPYVRPAQGRFSSSRGGGAPSPAGRPQVQAPVPTPERRAPQPAPSEQIRPRQVQPNAPPAGQPTPSEPIRPRPAQPNAPGVVQPAPGEQVRPRPIQPNAPASQPEYRPPTPQSPPANRPANTQPPRRPAETAPPARANEPESRPAQTARPARPNEPQARPAPRGEERREAPKKKEEHREDRER